MLAKGRLSYLRAGARTKRMRSESEIKGLTKKLDRASGALASVRVRRITFGGWIVSDQELESLKSAADTNSLDFGLFGVAFGAALTLGITIKTVAIVDLYAYFAFWAGFLVTSLAALYFAIRSILSHRATNAL